MLADLRNAHEFRDGAPTVSDAMNAASRLLAGEDGPTPLEDRLIDAMESIEECEAYQMNAEHDLAAARRELGELALAVGYGERPEGQDVIHHPDGPTLAGAWLLERKVLGLVEGLLGVGDDAPSDAVVNEVKAVIEERDEARATLLGIKRRVMNELRRIERDHCSECGNGRGLVGKLAEDVRSIVSIEPEPDLPGEIRALRAELENERRAHRAHDAGQDALEHRAEKAEGERDRLATDAICALSAAGIATPEKGYVVEPVCLSGDIAKVARERDVALRALRDLQVSMRETVEEWPGWLEMVKELEAARTRAERAERDANFARTDVERSNAERDAATARAEKAESHLDLADRISTDAVAHQNSLYQAILRCVSPHFEEGDRGLDWDVLPGTLGALAKERAHLAAQVDILAARTVVLRAALEKLITSFTTTWDDSIVFRAIDTAREVLTPKDGAA
jgi:hypothetical protein